VMTERILELATPVTVELVLHRAKGGGPGGEGFGKRGVDVGDVHVQGDRRPAEGLRPPDSHVGELVGQHDHRVADGQLGMAHPSTGYRHHHAHLGIQHGLVELDGILCSGHVEVRGDAGVVVGDRVDHGILQSGLQPNRTPARRTAHGPRIRRPAS